MWQHFVVQLCFQHFGSVELLIQYTGLNSVGWCRGSSTSPNPLLFPISIGAVYLWTCSGPWHSSSPPPLQGLSVHLINELWPTEARGKTLIDFKEIWPSPWLSFYHSSAWRGTKGNGFCHRLSALISLLNQIPIIQTYWKPLEASICKFQKKMQSCALHRLADLSTIFEPNWFRSKVKAHPVPINHLSSHSVFAAATTHTPWTLIHSFTPSKVAPQPLALFFLSCSSRTNLLGQL